MYQVVSPHRRVARKAIREATREATMGVPDSRLGGEGDQESLVRFALPAKEFIFTQASIASSVATEKNSWFIQPDTARYVNANGDTWSNASMKANYLTFIGAFNFVNHVQVPDRSVGFIADAVLRRIVINADEQLYIHYVDILVATSRQFSELCSKILDKTIDWLSMGCDMKISTCSVCGNVAKDDVELCDHLSGTDKGKFFIDKHGVKRVVAELLGTESPGSCVFIEASWLTEPPAFGGACKRHVLPLDDDMTVVVRMPSWAAERPAVQRWAVPFVVQDVALLAA